MQTTRDEIAEKCERVAALARAAEVQGILLTLQPSFAWLTAGRSNRIDGSREPGAGALLVTTSGRRFIVANAIECPRLATEALAGLDFEVIEYPWADERADPGTPVRLAARAAGGRIGTDGSSADAVALEPRIAALRAPLLRPEIDRYRRLGQDLGRIIGEVARAVPQGAREQEAAGLLAAALSREFLRPVVLLVAADERMARYRHPTPTTTRWRNRLLLATCAERDGLVGAASRIVSAGAADADLLARTEAAARVCASLLDATRPSASGAALFEAAAAAYTANGYPGEERRHHQGGAIGYRAREWVAHPASTDVVRLPQAFAWNPTVTGTKIEETVLVREGEPPEVLTRSPGWPGIELKAQGSTIVLPMVLKRDV